MIRENLADHVVQAGISLLGASPRRRQPDKLDDGLLRVIVTRLEIRGKNPFVEQMLREYLDAMRIDAATTELDTGCGTGVAA